MIYDDDGKVLLVKEHYYSHLTNDYPKDEYIERTTNLIKKYKLQTMGQLTEFYLKNDIDLLTDAFENFIKCGVREYGLNPCHYYSTPGFTWDCGEKFTGMKLPYIKDTNELYFWQESIRGGVSSVMGSRYVETKSIVRVDNSVNEICHYDYNNKVCSIDPQTKRVTINLDDDDDDNDDDVLGTSTSDKLMSMTYIAHTHILYVDANNLYGWAMIQYLPYDDINFTDDVTLDTILSTPDDADVGYFVECDMTYPDSIKKKSCYFPFCPEKMAVNINDLSEYQRGVMNEHHRPQEKLMCTQTDKIRYKVHYRMLKFYVRQGMQITKIHRVVSFKQKPWLAPYINHNTKMRAKATTKSQKDFFKLMNNSFYGKTMENVEDRCNIRFYNNNGDDDRKIINSHSELSFDGEVLFDDFRAHRHNPTNILYDKPIYIGATVLDLSKLLMYEFYYDILQSHFGEDKLQLHYMDTDSFVLSIKIRDSLENHLEQLNDHFDFSNLDKTHSLYSRKNEKVVGKFKIETGPYLTIDKFVALASKLYSYTVNEKEHSKMKGVSSKTNKIEFIDFINCLRSGQNLNGVNVSMRSHKHTISVQEVNKTAVSAFDDKRLYLNVIINFPHGVSEEVAIAITEENIDVINDLMKWKSPTTDTFDDKMFCVGGKTLPHGYV